MTDTPKTNKNRPGGVSGILPGRPDASRGPQAPSCAPQGSSRVPIGEYFARKKARKAKRTAKRVQLFGRKRSRKTQVAILDAKFGLYIKARDNRELGGICPFCKTKPIQQVFHISSRYQHFVLFPLALSTIYFFPNQKEFSLLHLLN